MKGTKYGDGAEVLGEPVVLDERLGLGLPENLLNVPIVWRRRERGRVGWGLLSKLRARYPSVREAYAKWKEAQK